VGVDFLKLIDEYIASDKVQEAGPGGEGSRCASGVSFERGLEAGVSGRVLPGSGFQIGDRSHP